MRMEFVINSTYRQVAHCLTCGDPVIYAGELVHVDNERPRCDYCRVRLEHGASS